MLGRASRLLFGPTVCSLSHSFRFVRGPEPESGEGNGRRYQRRGVELSEELGPRQLGQGEGQLLGLGDGLGNHSISDVIMDIFGESEAWVEPGRGLILGSTGDTV